MAAAIILADLSSAPTSAHLARVSRHVANTTRDTVRKSG